MTDTGWQHDLAFRLEQFERQIESLRQKIARAKEDQRREAAAKLDRLRLKHRELQEGVKELKRARERFHQESQADLEKVAHDLSAGLTEFINWVDRDYHGKPPAI